MRKNAMGIFLMILVLVFFGGSPAWAQDGAKLLEAIMYQEFDKAKDLVRKGVDVDYQDGSYGSTALMLACQFAFVDMARFLVEHNAELDLQAKNGQTALMAAARASEELFDLLISRGADVELKDEHGLTALTHAFMGLLGETGSWSVLETLLEKGADVNESPTTGPAAGYTLLMMAAENDRADLISGLVAKGADVNRRAKDGRTALALARKGGHKEVIALLIAAGAKD